MFLKLIFPYSVNSNISRMDLVTFWNNRESCLEKQGKQWEFRRRHQIHAAYIRVNTVVPFSPIPFF